MAKLIDDIRKIISGKFKVTSIDRKGSRTHSGGKAIDFVPLTNFEANWYRLHKKWNGQLGVSPKPYNKHIHVGVGSKSRWVEIADEKTNKIQVFYV